MRTVASVVSVSDSSKSLKVKSRSRSDWADGNVATFKHTQVLGSEGDTAGETVQRVEFLPATAHQAPESRLETTYKINSSLVS